MSGKKPRRKAIPPGAPGHPIEAGAPRKPRASPAERPARPEPRTRRPPGAAVSFVYEDEDFIAADKPAGLPVIAPEGGRGKSLLDIVTARLRRDNPRARAAVVHRIDRDTSGIVVFAKSGEAKRRAMSGWDELVAERGYVALVEGKVEGESGVLDSWLAEAGPSRMRVAEPGERGAQRAITRWRRLVGGEAYSLLELRLETGRRHQIRVQLAAMGHPIAGDERYGAKSDPLSRLCLHAELLDMTNPLTGRRFRLESPCPPSFRDAASSRGGRRC